MGVRQAYDARGASAQTPACLGPNAARVGPRAREAREPGEEARTGYQEERQEWPGRGLQDPGQGSGADTKVGWFHGPLLLVADSTDCTGGADTFRSSIRCARNYKPFRFVSRYERSYHVYTTPPPQLLTTITPQTVRSNEQMMQSMKGATMLLGSMNRQMNLPALQRIAMEFERENEVMDERQEMMDDAIDEATGMEGEEEEGEDIVKEVLDEIGVDLGQAVR